MIRSSINPDRIEADYLIETAFDPMHAAEIMAGEQSSGTFVPVPGETPELKERSAARVERLEILGAVAEPTLPGSGIPKTGAGLRQQAKVTLLANRESRTFFAKFDCNNRGKFI